MAMAGKTFPAFPEHGQTVPSRIWQEAHWVFSKVLAHPFIDTYTYFYHSRDDAVMAHVVSTILYGRQEYVYPTQSISWLLVTWESKWCRPCVDMGDGGGRPSSVISLGVTSVGGHSHGHPASPIGVGSLWEDIDPRSPEPLVVKGGRLWLIWVVRWTT